MTIYIENINPYTTEKKLTRMFKKFGKVSSVILASEQKFGLREAYGYVEMENSLEAKSAILHLNGSTRKRHIISVTPATILKNTNSFYEI